jgi:hypothetical protein
MKRILLGVALLALLMPLAGCVVYDGPYGGYYAASPYYYRAYPYPYYTVRPYYGYYGYRYRYGH